MDLLAPSCTTKCLHYYTLETLLPLEAIGLNAFIHPWMFQVSYVFLPPTLVLVLSKFLVEHVKGQLRLLILVAPCLMEAPWLPTVLNMLADISQDCPIIKEYYCGCFVRPHAQGSAISAFNPLAAQRYMLCRQGLSSSVYR